MLQIRFRPGLGPRRRRWELTALSHDPVAGFKGPLLRGRDRNGLDGNVKEGIGWQGTRRKERGREARGGEGD